MRARISSRILRVPSSRSSREPVRAAGSAKLQCKRLVTPGSIGQRSAPVSSQTVITYGKKFSALKNIEYALRFLAGDIDSDFFHGFDRERVERAGLESCAVRFEIIGTSEIQKRFRHLAAGAVVNTNE